MKKFISFVMAGAMVASLVPATAFAAGDVTATAKIVDAKKFAKPDENSITIPKNDAPELQIKVTGTDYKLTEGTVPTMDVTVSLDNAEFINGKDADFSTGADGLITIEDKSGNDLTQGVGNSDSSTSTWVPIKDDTTTTHIRNTSGRDSKEIAKVGAYTQRTGLDGVLGLVEDFDREFAFSGGTSATVTGGALDDITLANTAGDKKIVVAKDSKTLAMSSKEIAAAINDGYTTVAGTDAANVTIKNLIVTGATVENVAFADGATITLSDAATTGASTPVLTAGVQSAARMVEFGNYEYGTFDNSTVTVRKVTVAVKPGTNYADQVTLTFSGQFASGDLISMDMATVMNKVSEGKTATVSVDSKMISQDDLVFASVLGKGLKASVKKTVDVAVEETTKIYEKGIVIEPAVDKFQVGDKITIKLSKGFEFVKSKLGTTDFGSLTYVNEREMYLTVSGSATDKITLKDTEIEATTAKSGSTATFTLSMNNADSTTVDVAKVVDYKVTLSVDKDEDTPVIWNGTNAENKGLTAGSDKHWTKEITAEETFPGAWSSRQGFNITVPDGVYVTDIKIINQENFKKDSGNDLSDTEWKTAFEEAYKKGNYKTFEFAKRIFDDVSVSMGDREKASITFQLEVVADPDFVSDVVVGLEGDLVDKQEVVAATFKAPFTVKAEQNDMIIDYRNTEIKTPVVVTEAEDGLWEKDAKFAFNVEYMDFEDDGTFAVNEGSGMTIKEEGVVKVNGSTNKDGSAIGYTVKAESDDEAAAVTMSDLKLYMNRSLAAGPYALKLSRGTDAYNAYLAEVPFNAQGDIEDIEDVTSYKNVLKPAFVNIVTSGRDQDDASFTTKVVVPVGEAYLLAGETKVDLDVPAYISAAGYTMLPVRAVAKALGVNNNNVLWNAEARVVTIMYGQRIVTMTVGAKEMHVNGSTIPASAAVEIKDGRAFLPMRDLATALGVSDITWDAATRTATMNGNR